MLIIPEFRKQNQAITFPLEKIGLAQNLENASEMREVLNALMNQKGIVCWVDMRSHPHGKHQTCQSVFHQ